MKKLLVLLILSCFGMVSGMGAAFAQATSELTIVSGDATHEFQVEIADDDAERQQGLMFREEMAEDHGMLFVYPQPQVAGVWMKNTLIPLDMLFIAQDGTIVTLARNARPGSERIIESGLPVVGFLEINGGQADVLGIKPGDIVRHSALGNLAGG